MPLEPKPADFPRIRSALRFYQICSIITGVGLLLLLWVIFGNNLVTPG